MECSESTAGQDMAGSTQVDQTVVLNSKPLHRFVKREPKTLGIVIVIFGCAEFLMGSQMSIESGIFFGKFVPYWQGFLFLVCGSLSIYTEVHPSKKLVTVCLSMYIVTVLGIIVSFIYRTIYLIFHEYTLRRRGFSRNSKEQVVWIESILVVSSGCALVLLIFLCTVARIALTSTRNQVIVHHVRPSQTTITSF